MAKINFLPLLLIWLLSLQVSFCLNEDTNELPRKISDKIQEKKAPPVKVEKNAALKKLFKRPRDIPVIVNRESKVFKKYLQTRIRRKTTDPLGSQASNPARERPEEAREPAGDKGQEENLVGSKKEIKALEGKFVRKLKKKVVKKRNPQRIPTFPEEHTTTLRPELEAKKHFKLKNVYNLDGVLYRKPIPHNVLLAQESNEVNNRPKNVFEGQFTTIFRNAVGTTIEPFFKPKLVRFDTTTYSSLFADTTTTPRPASFTLDRPVGEIYYKPIEDNAEVTTSAIYYKPFVSHEESPPLKNTYSSPQITYNNDNNDNFGSPTIVYGFKPVRFVDDEKEGRALPPNEDFSFFKTSYQEDSKYVRFPHS